MSKVSSPDYINPISALDRDVVSLLVRWAIGLKGDLSAIFTNGSSLEKRHSDVFRMLQRLMHVAPQVRNCLSYMKWELDFHCVTIVSCAVEPNHTCECTQLELRRVQREYKYGSVLADVNIPCSPMYDLEGFCKDHRVPLTGKMEKERRFPIVF